MKKGTDTKQMINMTPEASNKPLVATIEQVPEERRDAVLSILSDIEITPSFTMAYASEASKALMQNSDTILQDVRLKDNPEVEEMLTSLMGELQKLDPDSAKANFIQRLFKVDTLAKFLQKYDSIESVVDDIAQKLEATKFQLRKDSTYCETQKAETLNYIRALENYIMAGELKIAELKTDIKEDKDSLSDDIIDVQIWSDENNDLQNFENKIRDLRFMRYVAGLSLAQLSMLQSGNNALANKLESSTGPMITLWKQQMTTATLMMRQKTALALQQNVRATTNKLVQRTSEMLHAGSIEVAKELEASIVDVDTLVASTNNLIATVTDVKKIRLDAAKKNQEGLRKLEEAQTKLNALRLTSG